MQAIILSIGDELVLGQTVDTNSAFLSAELVKLGIGTVYHQTVADDRAMIAQAIGNAAGAADVVIISGGIGPTDDDLTRDALSDALGAELYTDERALAAIQEMFSKRNRIMPERNKLQAMRPRGTETIPNSCGTAPGIIARHKRATIYVTPGVPSEMFAMWNLSIRPAIEKLGAADGKRRGIILTCKVNTFGLGESTVAELLGNLMDRKRNPIVGTTVAGGVVSVRVRSEFDDPRKAQAELDDTLAKVEAAVGGFAYGREEETLAMSVVRTLKKHGKTLATAESCTGGLVSGSITDIPGSSAVFLGGWVTYSNELKTSQLGVPEEMLAAHGAVSAPVARAMAINAAKRSGADYAIAITGIAGPDGGTPTKPVGLVFAGLARRNAAGDLFAEVMQLNVGGSRDMVRDRAGKCALQMLRFDLLNQPLDQWTWGRRISEDGA